MSTRIDSTSTGAADVCLPDAAPSFPTTDYVVKPGDTLSKLADGLRKEGIPGTRDEVVRQLLELNPQVTDKNLIRVGQHLTLPKPPEAKPTSAESNHVETFSPNASYDDGSHAQCLSEDAPTYSAAMLMMSGAPSSNQSTSASAPRSPSAPASSPHSSGAKKPSSSEKKNAAPAQSSTPKAEETNASNAPSSKAAFRHPRSPDGTPVFSQSDPEWAAVLVGKDRLFKTVTDAKGKTHLEERSHAMAAIGCATSGAAMAVSKELGYEVTPGELAKTANGTSGYGSSDGINWLRVGETYGLNAAKSSLSREKLDAALEGGHAVIIDVNHSSENRGRPDHWITVTRKDERIAGRYWANDPAGGKQIALRMNEAGQLESEEKLIGLRRYLTTGDMVTFTPKQPNFAEFHPSNAPLR